MQTKQFEIWIADLNPQIGTEPRKTRPVLIVQTNLLNSIPHPSTIICPITTNVKKVGDLPLDLAELVQENIKIILEL
jgi:mRNA interferase MazF